MATHRAIPRSGQTLTFLGIERDKDEYPMDVWPVGPNELMRLSVWPKLTHAGSRL